MSIENNEQPAFRTIYVPLLTEDFVFLGVFNPFGPA
jgi:hypothetical protein